MPVSITNNKLQLARQGVEYTDRIIATGAPGGEYFLTAVGLPKSFTVDSNGWLRGKPEETGSFTVTFTATDPADPTNSATVTLTLVINLPELQYTFIRLATDVRDEGNESAPLPNYVHPPAPGLFQWLSLKQDTKTTTYLQSPLSGRESLEGFWWTLPSFVQGNFLGVIDALDIENPSPLGIPVTAFTKKDGADTIHIHIHFLYRHELWFGDDLNIGGNDHFRTS
jgi:hypothetical protein